MDRKPELRNWMILRNIGNPLSSTSNSSPSGPSSLCGIIIMENEGEAIDCFSYVYDYNPDFIKAIEITTEQLVNIVGHDRMRKCMTQTDSVDYIAMNSHKFKPNECTIYATECTNFECEDSYICQNCKRNREFGMYLGTRVYRLVYLSMGADYKLELIRV